MHDLSDVASLVEIQPEATVSRTVLQAEGARVVLFSFDAGQVSARMDSQLKAPGTRDGGDRAASQRAAQTPAAVCRYDAKWFHLRDACRLVQPGDAGSGEGPVGRFDHGDEVTSVGPGRLDRGERLLAERTDGLDRKVRPVRLRPGQ